MGIQTLVNHAYKPNCVKIRSNFAFENGLQVY
jgi:hypothetical protein